MIDLRLLEALRAEQKQLGTTFQARRLNIRYRDADGKTQIAATLNGTLATTRMMVPLLENHQQPDGSVRVPKALQPFVGRDVLTP